MRCNIHSFKWKPPSCAVLSPCGRLPGGRGHSNDFEDRGASLLSVGVSRKKVGSSKGDLDASTQVLKPFSAA